MMNKILVIVFVLISTVTHAQLLQPEWSKNVVMYEINVRQYSQEGTFNAVTKDLTRIKALGVDVLWIMPIHPIGVKNRKGEMGSYYSVQDYKEVSPDYGTKEDFKALVTEAHRLGMRVLIDWVANHTAWDHAWISQHPNWYEQNEKGEIVTQYDWTDVAKLNFKSNEMREAMIEAMKFWVSEYDIDGYRCDVAFLVPLDFWEELRRQLEKIKPVYMLAEMEWNADITRKPDTYFLNAFNAAYGWNFMGVTADVARGTKQLTDMKKELRLNYDAFPAYMHKLLFLTNHDENSWNGTVDEKYGKNWQQFGVMVYTLPQSLPLIYTGEEVGLNRRMKFFEKDNITKIEWANKSREAWYKRMTTLKHTVPAFYNTGTNADWVEIPLVVTGNTGDQHYAYKRKNGNSEAIIIINFSSNEIKVQSNETNFASLTKGYKMESNAKQKNKNGIINLQPNSYIIYYK